mmetsp:Transcript_54429/g.160069  ORF Transcript_54429/g.160069 Transcript_54429/m.160069 type:complete len:256 (-) Transcript_54429:457-1224(-)
MSSLCSSRLPTESPMFLSQKDLLSTSAAASSSSFLIRSLMRPRTFPKWSAPPARDTLAAMAASVGLFSLSASCCRRSAAALTAAWAPVLRRTCSRDTVFGAGALWTFTATVARPESFLLAFPYILLTSPDFRTSLASARALSSAERVVERWSNSLALSWHSVVSSSRKALSASMSSFSSSLSFSASSFSVVFFEESSSFLIFESDLNFFSLVQARTRLSETALASNSSRSSCFLFSSNSSASDSRVAMMSFERYS